MLNGLIFRVVFQRVNTMIGKEADYAAAEQVHPVLRTMVEVRWQTQYSYLAAESVYTESFLGDLLVNGPEEVQDISISKAAWLVKAIRVLRQLNAHGELSDTEIGSLDKLLTKYFRDECTEKGNRVMRSINRVGRNRYFARFLSYENALPHVYRVYSKSEDNYLGTLKAILNLTCDFGVRSLENSTLQDYSLEYRGNVSPYFNYKLVGLLEQEEKLNRTQLLESKRDDTVLSEAYDRVQELEETLAKNRRNELKLLGRIKPRLRDKVLADWQTGRRLYGRWSPEGESLEPDSHLVLVNALFLSD